MTTAPVALHLDPHDTSRSITLTTTRPIEKDQIVLAVPEPLLFTAAALALPLAEAAEAAGLDPLGRLALRLLAEAAVDDGPWLPYLRVLPQREEMHLPILWDDDENDEDGQSLPPPLLPLLAPSPLHDDIVECRAAMREELGAVRRALASGKGNERVLRLLDWRHWTWARAVAMSRPYILVRMLTDTGRFCNVLLFQMDRVTDAHRMSNDTPIHTRRTPTSSTTTRTASTPPPQPPPPPLSP
jgi:hypothetical protein